MNPNMTSHCLVFRDGGGAFRVANFRAGKWSVMEGNGHEESAMTEARRAALSIPVTITDQRVDLATLTPASRSTRSRHVRTPAGRRCGFSRAGRDRSRNPARADLCAS